MKDGVVLLDEIWRICDSRLSRKSSNRFVADILARSRKRHLVYIFTAQVIDTIDKRIRKVMDFCLPPDQEIVCNPEVKLINSINVGDKVLTHNGNFEKVVNVMKRKYNGTMYKILSSHMEFPLKLTEGHPILIAEPIFKRKYNINKFWKETEFNYITKNYFTKKVREQAKKLGMNEDNLYAKRQRIQKNIKFEFKWKKPEELQKNDLLAYPIIKEIKDKEKIKLSDFFDAEKHRRWKFRDGFWHNNGNGLHKIKDEIEINDNFLKLLGYYIGDGSLHKTSGRVCITLNRKHKEKIKETKMLFKDIFNLNAKESVTNNTGVHITIGAYPISALFENLCGYGCKNKKIPQWAMTLPLKKQEALLDGYLATDGHKLKSCGKHRFSAHSFSTISKLLASQLAQIILRLGYKVYISKERMKLGTTDAYMGYISKQKGNSFIFNGYYLMPIKQIRKTHYKGIVHNLEVANANSYATQSICCHNCNYCLLHRTEKSCKVIVFRTGYCKPGNFMKQFYYTTEVPFMCYSTDEEVDMEDDYELGKVVTEPKLIWQEGIAKCKKCGTVITTGFVCTNCESKDLELIEPIYFNSWEEADRHAEAYWQKKFAEMKVVVKDD